jgi:RNA 2',3'-cyclic 3'-phosphodiesterase
VTPAARGGAAPAEGARRPEPDRHRVFIAVPLSPAVREAAADARRLFAAHTDRFRWVSPRQLHLTLAFLGDITAAQMTKAVEAARAAAGSCAPFAVTFAGLGAFPSLAAPRVVWAGVTHGGDRVTVLAAALADALRARRFVLDPRPFTPHLTLARARGTGRPPNLRGETAALERAVLGEQSVTELIVVKSVLGSSEPAHTVIATARLGDRPRSLEVS